MVLLLVTLLLSLQIVQYHVTVGVTKYSTRQHFGEETTTSGFLFVRFLPLDYRKIRQKLSFSIFIEFLQWQKLSFWENPIKFWENPIEFWENSNEFFFRIEISRVPQFSSEFRIYFVTRINGTYTKRRCPTSYFHMYSMLRKNLTSGL